MQNRRWGIRDYFTRGRGNRIVISEGEVKVRPKDKEFVLFEETEEGFTAQFGLNIRTGFEESENLFYAYCDTFGLSDYAETADLAVKGIIEVIQTFIETTVEDENLHEVLREAGFKPSSPTPYHKIFSRKIRKQIDEYIRSDFELNQSIKEGALAAI